MSLEQTFGEFWVRALERRGITIAGDTITPAVANQPQHSRNYLLWLARRYGVELTPAPTDIAWAGSHTVAEDAALGTVVGGALSGTDPGGLPLTFSAADPSAKFNVNGTSVVVAGVLDFDVTPSILFTVRATNSGNASFDKTFTITVTDVAQTPPDDPLPPGEDIPGDENDYDLPPYSIEVDGAVNLAGKKKDNGLLALMLHNIQGEPGFALAAGKVYTMRYTTDFTQMENDGVLNAVGFMFRATNDFYFIGAKGDGSPTGINKYEVQGENKWNQHTGFVVNDGGDMQNGTQAGPTMVQLEVNEAGTAITFRSSGDGGNTFDDEFTEIDFTPFGNVSEVTAWGPGAIFDAADQGPYSIPIELWTVQELGYLSWRFNVTASVADACSITEMEFYDGTTKLSTTGATVISSHPAGTAGGGAATVVFDGNTAVDNWWSSSLTQGWVGVTFASKKRVDKVGVVARSGQGPTTGSIQRTNTHPTGWTDQWAVTNFEPVWPEKRWTTDPTAGYKHHRIRFVNLPSGAVRLGDAEFRATIGGPDVSVQALSRRVSQDVIGIGVSAVFDNNSATHWAATASGARVELYFEKGVMPTIAQIMMRAPSFNQDQAPVELRYDTSVDGSNWTNAFTQTGFPAWTASETRTYNV